MSTTNDTHSIKGGRDTSLREEQAFCQEALESGAYDSLSDQAWVSMCEMLATKSRQVAEHDTETDASSDSAASDSPPSNL